MTDPENIRRLVRKNFDYLTTTFGFVEELNITTDNIYSEVQYKKSDWTLSIVTTAHGTKISLSLISPTGDIGFLTHYFNILDSNYENPLDRTMVLADNVKYNSGFLKIHGQDILEGNPIRLTDILDLIKIEHEKWAKPLSRRLSDL